MTMKETRRTFKGQMDDRTSREFTTRYRRLIPRQSVCFRLESIGGSLIGHFLHGLHSDPISFRRPLYALRVINWPRGPTQATGRDRRERERERDRRVLFSAAKRDLDFPPRLAQLSRRNAISQACAAFRSPARDALSLPTRGSLSPLHASPSLGKSRAWR